MVFLMFRLGADRYVLDARQVAAVLPLVAIKAIPQTPPAVAGVIDVHGDVVPVVDLSQLAFARPAQRSLSTRIVLVDVTDARGERRPLGLIAEHATETLKRDATDFVDSGVATPDARWLGRVATDADGIVQWLLVEHILPPDLRDRLYQHAEAGG